MGGRWMDNIMTPLGSDRCHTGSEDQTDIVVDDAAKADNSTCPGWVEILVHLVKFPGRRVLHCHFLNHEDHGMMSWMQVCDPSVTNANSEAFCPVETEETE